MKLKIIGFDMKIVFGDSQDVLLVINDHALYSQVIYTLEKKVNDGEITNEIILTDDKDDLIVKDIILFTDIISFDFNSKKIISKLYTKIEEMIMDDYESLYTLRSINDRFNNIIQDELNNLNIEFDFSNEIAVSNFLKQISLKFSKINKKTVYDAMITYLEMISELFPTSTLLICNSLMFFTSEQIREICKLKNYKHMNVLFVENMFDRDFYFKKYIIDEDLYENVVK